ncbi:MAG TPA: PASTA domain-containing protein [Microthrixaceae bacterium]|nr:PASTA domain-containing protein [Microthrixaceae bacterium]HMT23607.1 PASTA domain-containing protein [Microthrixaceae bacterium]HMT60015.1 PASTA domain-containing protein [Microthrixaceae bacterium]
MSAAPVRRSATGPPEVVDGTRSRLKLTLGIGVVAALLGLAIVQFVAQLQPKESVELARLELPSVAGLDIAGARGQLEALGLVVNVLFRPNESVAKGAVFAQDPLAGRLLQQGDVVRIIASDGPLGQSVPAVSGQQALDATAVISAAGLTPQTVDTPHESIRVGEVIGTNPAAGSRAPAGAAVQVLVSSGPAPRTVPAMVNLPLAQALVELGRSGLAVGTIRKVHREDQPEGVVLSTSPAAGAAIPKDTPVEIEVTGPAPTAEVPYLAGLSQGTAESLLKAADLVAKVVPVPVAAGDLNAGRVLSQGMPPGAEIAPGTTVEISVAVASG